MLPAKIVLRLVSTLQLSDGAFIVGGQALNIWAERYSHIDELKFFGPYTSKDVDYFGYRDAAKKLAEAIGGKLRIPDRDDATPQSAIVEAKIDGYYVEIDFLTHVLGVPDKRLKNSAVDIIFNVRSESGVSELRVPIMHPFHCMMSRVANIVKLNREGDTARRQLEASFYVVREYISEMLECGNHREATDTLKQIFDYICSDINGKKAYLNMANDPASIISHFVDDKRIDARYRKHTLASMKKKLQKMRCTS